MNKFKCNESYFSVIDTEYKAYFLGLLMADGCVYKRKEYKSFIIKISLQERDGYILEKFSGDIKYEGELKLRKASGNAQNQLCLSIASEQIYNDLIKLNCVPNKSLILEFPPVGSIPTHLMNHFIRGYFDGDGCITHNLETQKQNPKFRADFASTLKFCEKIKQIIYSETGILGKIKKQGNIFRLRFCGNKRVRALYPFMYKDATVFLLRKKEKFNYLNRCEVINTSKYKHVYFRPNDTKGSNLTKKWMSTIKSLGKTRYVGSFLTERDAYLALCEFEEKNQLPFSNDPSIFLLSKSCRP